MWFTINIYSFTQILSQGSQYGSLPVYLFGGAAITGAFLVIFSPETFKKKLPDSLEEAKELWFVGCFGKRLKEKTEFSQ